jgi:hypothetical protein
MYTTKQLISPLSINESLNYRSAKEMLQTHETGAVRFLQPEHYREGYIWPLICQN